MDSFPTSNKCHHIPGGNSLHCSVEMMYGQLSILHPITMTYIMLFLTDQIGHGIMG
jgi:hypothetical protein